jgi:hypothetical protein
MHDENLKDLVFSSIFDDEDIYRRLYVPTVYHMQKNPDDKDRVIELVDNAIMHYCKNNNLNYDQMPSDLKREVAIDLYQSMIENETPGSQQ